MDDIDKIDSELKYYIDLVEIDKENKEALANVALNFLKLMECIKIALIEKKERYYGYIFMNFNVSINYNVIYEAAVTIDTSPFTMIVNPLLLGKYKIKEIIYIICHEIEHLALEHPAEGLKYNPSNNNMLHYLLNLSMDASVNDRLNFDINECNFDILLEPDNCITSAKLGAMFKMKLNDLESFLYYFNIIKDRFKRLKGEDYGRDSYAEDVEYIIVYYDQTCNQIVTKKDLDEKKIIFVITTNANDSRQVRTKIKQFFKEVIDGIPGEFKGLFPNHQKETIAKLLAAPKINWMQILKKYIGIVPDSYRKTKMRINRRQPLRYDVSGRLNNKIISLVVAIDTSSSLERFHLEKIYIEIFGILKNKKYKLTIIECDDSIQKVYNAKTTNDLDYNLSGRGGTSFEPVIRYINENPTLRGSILIYFTDGFGEKSISKPRTLRNIWVVFNDVYNLSLDNPYGDVIALDLDDL